MDSNEKTITTKGSAVVYAPSDLTTVRVRISGKKDEYKDAVKELAENINKLRDAIEKAGLDGKVLRTEKFSVNQATKGVSDKDGRYKSLKDGFHYQTTVYFEFPNDANILSDAVYNIMKLKVTPVISFGFRNSNPEKMKEDALRKATENALNQAKIIVETTGHKLGSLLYVNRDLGWSSSKQRETYDYELGDCDCFYSCDGGESSKKINVEPVDDTESEHVTLTWEIAD